MRGLTCIRTSLGAWRRRVFYRHYSRRDVITFCVGHLVFEAVAGTVYAAVHHDLPLSAAL